MCIRDRLYWGHRIPAYFLTDGTIVVGETPEIALEEARKQTGDQSLEMKDLTQDPDTLDTWFSSCLLYTSPYSPSLYELSLSTKHEVIWHCLVGQSRKWKEEYLYQPLADGTMLKVSRVDGHCTSGSLIRFEWSNEMTFGELLEHLGELPIPPYLNRDTEEKMCIRDRSLPIP